MADRDGEALERAGEETRQSGAVVQLACIDGTSDSWSATIPLRRVAKPEDVGDVIAFLASSEASYLNGCCIPVDGGILA